MLHFLKHSLNRMCLRTDGRPLFGAAGNERAESHAVLACHLRHLSWMLADTLLYLTSTVHFCIKAPLSETLLRSICYLLHAWSLPVQALTIWQFCFQVSRDTDDDNDNWKVLAEGTMIILLLQVIISVPLLIIHAWACCNGQRAFGGGR